MQILLVWFVAAVAALQTPSVDEGPTRSASVMVRAVLWPRKMGQRAPGSPHGLYTALGTATSTVDQVQEDAESASKDKNPRPEYTWPPFQSSTPPSERSASATSSITVSITGRFGSLS